MNSRRVEGDLMEAAQAGDINSLYASIRADPDILERIDGIPFPDTPLHAAASAGRTHFAIEIISLMPSFGRKLNPDGLSPLHLALQNGHFETVKRLVKFDSELVRVKGKEGLTLLHRVAGTDNVALLAEFLCACPKSIEDLTIRNETALHIAVKNNHFATFKVLLEWLRRTENEKLLSWRDDEGNTVTRIAETTNQGQIVVLATKAVIIKSRRNLESLTAVDIASRLNPDEDNMEVRDLLTRADAATAVPFPNDGPLNKCFDFVLRVDLIFQQGLSMEMRNLILVVAILIATATYQAILTPPGGGGSQGDYNSPINCTSCLNTTTTTMSTKTTNPPLSSTPAGKSALEMFYSINTMAFCFSITMIILALPWEKYTFLLHASLSFLGLSYMVLLSGLVSMPTSLSGKLTLFIIFPISVYTLKTYFLFLRIYRESGLGRALLL